MALQLTDRGDIQVYDLDREILSSLTLNEINAGDPVWIDNNTILFSANTDGGFFNIYQQSVGADVSQAVLPPGDNNRWAEGYHQGNAIFLIGQGFGAGVIAITPIGQDTETEILFDAPYNLDEPNISPDGQWLSYTANSSGQFEVYVRPLAGGNAVQVSRDGGGQPRWTRDSTELTFMGLDASIYAVALENGEPGEPEELFQTGLAADPIRDQYAVTADGQRFLVFQDSGVPTLTVVLNWTSELEDQ